MAVLAADEWKQYEIINGALFVTRAHHWQHQRVIANLCLELQLWSRTSGLGEAIPMPGILFTESHKVLSAGTTNERRDREAKLKLYSIQGVQDYWIVNWRSQQIEVYRRQATQLNLQATLLLEDNLTFPCLPAFDCPVERILG